MTGFNFGAMLSQNNQIKQIPLDMLVPFHNHQFSLYDGERRDDMVESIRKNGVMTPIVCRPNPDGTDTYEILIGHNRWNCSKIAGLETIPAIIKEQLTEEEAQTYVDESNLIQRGFNDLKVSEQARIIARRYSEMFSQGKRNDIINEIRVLNGEETSSGNSREKVADEYGLSRNTIARLVRISKLSDGILGWIDKGQLAVRAGVELSYLSADEQSELFEINSADDNMLMKISEAQARDLRILSADGVLDGDEMLKVLSAKKKKPDKKVSIAPTLYKKYFAGLSNEEIADTVAAALDMFFKSKEKAITMTKAVLFQKSGQPVLFTDYAEYDTGTGYIVTENKEKGICYICRILDKSEIFNYNDRILPIVIKKKGLKEISVILVTDKYRSIAEAEQHYPELLGGNNYDS